MSLVDGRRGRYTAPRWPWGVLVVASVAAASALLPFEHGRSWHFFADAGAGLFDRALFRDHPEFQFGPAAATIAGAASIAPPEVGLWLVMTAGSAAGVATLWLVSDATGWSKRHGAVWPTIVVGGAFLVPWVRLAAYSAHVDDVVALSSTAGAAWALSRGRWTTATLSIAAAVAVKPWAIVVTPLLLFDPVPHRWRRLSAVGALVALTWMPYVTTAGTVRALGQFGILVDPNSGLRAVGLTTLATPHWLRPIQLATASAAAAGAARRAGPLMVPLAGIGVRLALDPATHHYYTVGFVVAALLAECSLPRVVWPWRTLLGAVVLELAAFDIALGGLVRELRLGLLTAAVLATLATGSAPVVRRRDGTCSAASPTAVA